MTCLDVNRVQPPLHLVEASHHHQLPIKDQAEVNFELAKRLKLPKILKNIHVWIPGWVPAFSWEGARFRKSSRAGSDVSLIAVATLVKVLKKRSNQIFFAKKHETISKIILVLRKCRWRCRRIRQSRQSYRLVKLGMADQCRFHSRYPRGSPAQSCC